MSEKEELVYNYYLNQIPRYIISYYNNIIS